MLTGRGFETVRGRKLALAGVALLMLGCGAADAPPDVENHATSGVGAENAAGWDAALEASTQCDNGPGKRASVYYFARMDRALAQSPELRATVGTSKIETCDQARAFIEADNERSDALEESWIEPSEAPQVEPALEPKIHVGQTVSYDAGGYSVTGVMQLKTSRGICSAFLVSRWHVIAAAHCFTTSGLQNIQLKGFNASGVWGQIRANGVASDNIDVFVYIYPGYNGDNNRSSDLALISLQTNTIEHAHRLSASNERINLFRMYTGPTRLETKLHIYGIGVKGYDGSGAGTLRRGHDGARITVDQHDNGWFKADAHTARTCEGDSGGPAIEWPTDTTAPVVWGAAIGGGTWFWNDDACPHEHDNMYWTKLNNKAAWIEEIMRNNVNLGANFNCGRFTHTETGETYMKCW